MSILLPSILIEATRRPAYCKNTENQKVDQNPPIIAHEHELLTSLRQAFLFSKRSTAVIDGNEKRNGWLNFELQCLHVT